MKNTLKFGPTARLNTAFANLDRSAAVADSEDDVEHDDDDDSDSDDEDDSEDVEDEDEDDSDSDDEDDDSDSDDEDDDSDSDDDSEDVEDEDEDDSDSDDEDDDSDSDEDEAESDEFEEDVTDFEPDASFDEDEDEDSEDEEDASCDEDDDESDADEEEYEVESEDAEAAAIAQLEQAGRCIVIATTDDTAILDSDMEAAIAKLEDDEFAEASEEDDEDDTFEEVIADDEDDEDDTFEEVIAGDESDSDDSDVDEDEDDSEDDSDSDDEDSEDDEAEDEDDSEDDSDVDEDSEDDEDDSDSDGEDSEDDEDDSEDDEDDSEDDEDDEDDDGENLAPVATEEFLANASADDVEFHLTDNATNPVLNVIVAGIPAARITLASFGEHAAEMADVFRTPRYADSLRKAMASQGVLNLLQAGNAEFYATAYRNTDLFEEAAASAEAVSNERVATAMAGLREDFVDACQLVHAGMDKNFFPMQHPLKRTLYIQLANAGVLNPSAVIETAFAEASAAYFDVVANKAVEIMDKSAEAREELRAAIDEAGTIARTPGKAAHANTEIPVAQTQTSTAASSATLAIAHELASEQGQHQAVAAVTGSVADRKSAIRTLTGGFKPIGA